MKVLIVEDEKSALDRLKRSLLAIEPQLEVVGELASIRSAVDWFKTNLPPDLAFFDIQLADGVSFAIFEQADVACPVVFTTAYDEYALKAFQVFAVDYLLKPIRREDLAKTLKRVEQLGVVREIKGPLTSEMKAPYAKRFLIRYGDRMRSVDVEEVAYFYSKEKATYLRSADGKDLPMDMSLDQLEKQLDPDRFFRMNRQLLVRREHIKELLAYSRSRVKVLLEPPYEDDAIVSTERSAEFKSWLGG